VRHLIAPAVSGLKATGESVNGPRQIRLAAFGTIKDRVFRCVRTADRAEQLLRGEIRISTLETWRRIEDAAQGDAEEGKHEYYPGPFSGRPGAADTRLIAQRIGFPRMAMTNFNVNNSVVYEGIPDAWGLCAAHENTPEVRAAFGEYVIRIRRPVEFFHDLTTALMRVTSLKEGVIGRVIYAERTYELTEPEPGPLGFVKPTSYASQLEVRMLWLPAIDKIEYLTINEPRLARYLSLVQSPSQGAP
jgi:hypothetical protein